MFSKTYSKKNIYILVASVLVVSIIFLIYVFFHFNKSLNVTNYVSTNDQRPFSIEVPKAWKSSTSNSFGGFTVFGENVPKYPDVKIYNDNKPIIAVYGNTLPKGYTSTSEEVAEVMKDHLVPSYLMLYTHDYKLIQKTDVILKDGSHASVIESSFVVKKGGPIVLNFHTLNLITIKNGIMYGVRQENE